MKSLCCALFSVLLGTMAVGSSAFAGTGAVECYTKALESKLGMDPARAADPKAQVPETLANSYANLCSGVSDTSWDAPLQCFQAMRAFPGSRRGLNVPESFELCAGVKVANDPVRCLQLAISKRLIPGISDDFPGGRPGMDRPDMPNRWRAMVALCKGT